jgi:hypothetical protein
MAELTKSEVRGEGRQKSDSFKEESTCQAQRAEPQWSCGHEAQGDGLLEPRMTKE